MYITGAFSTTSGLLILVIAGALALIVIGVLIYRLIYKENINKALNGENRKRIIDPKQFSTITFFIVLIGFLIITVIKLEELTNTVNNYNIQIDSQNSSISSLRGQISDLEDNFDEYLQLQKLVNSYHYSVVDITDEGKIVYKIEFTLNEKEVDSEIKLILQSGDTEMISDLTSTSLNYITYISLDDESEYDLFVMEEGIMIKQESIGSIDVLNDFGGRFDFDLSGGGDLSSFEFNFEIHNTYIGSNALLIDSVSVEVYYDDVLIDTVVATEANYTSQDFEYFHLFTEAEISATDPDFEDKIRFKITIVDNSGVIFIKEAGF